MTDLSASTSPTDPSPRVQIVLALGDALIFIFFAAAGRATHDLPPGDAPLLTTLSVAAPFAIAWVIVSALLGVYRRISFNAWRRWLPRTLIAWSIACALGLITRSVLLQRPIIAAFALTSLGINAALLLGWRAIVGFVHLRRLS